VYVSQKNKEFRKEPAASVLALAVLFGRGGIEVQCPEPFTKLNKTTQNRQARNPKILFIHQIYWDAYLTKWFFL